MPTITTKRKLMGSAASAARPSLQSAPASRSSTKDSPLAQDKVLLSYADLRALGIPYHRGSLWRLMRAGKFPMTVSLSPELYAKKMWKASDIAAYLAGLPYTNATNDDDAA
jgi:hypothetical protein